MSSKPVSSKSLVSGSNIVYVDENSINRVLAELILKEGEAFCVAVPTTRAMIDALSRTSFDVAVIDLETAAADPEGLEIAKRDPRFRDLPLLAVGADKDQAATIGAKFFAPAPLDPISFLAAVAQARNSAQSTNAAATEESIAQTALLSRVSGKPEAAAEILGQFAHDYAGFSSLIDEAAKRGDHEKVEFLLRNLRAAASAVGAEELFRLAAAIQDDAQRKREIKTEALGEAIGKALRSAARIRADLLKRSVVEELGDSRNLPLRGDWAAFPTSETESKHSPKKVARLLAVDDSPANLKFLEACLHEEYDIQTAENGEEAIKIARGPKPPALILLDVNMPGIDGYETCRLLKEDPRTRAIPVVFLTSLAKEADEERGLALGAVDYVRKPFSVPVLKARIRSHLDLQRYREYLETLVEERTRELRETQREVVYRLARAAEYRDNDTGSHIKRIGYYSMTMAEALGFPRMESDLLYFASSMHDVGKIGIPDHILLKPGKLDPDEWEIMKQHPAIGAGLLEGHPSELLREAARVALTHHEKWDGSGYPAKLAGEAIPMEGRIVAICDVFDALLSSRPYKRAWSFDETLDEVNRLSGTHFDPAIVHTFNDVYPEFVRIKERFGDVKAR